MEKIFYCPTQIITGVGVVNKLTQICEAYGKRVFVVLDPFFVGSPIEHMLQELLRDHELMFYTNICPNPRDKDIDEGGRLCKEHQTNVIVALGGGSTIDTAKAINVVAMNGGTCWEYTKRTNEVMREIQQELLPLIAIPTTSGTGTEATRYSVITHASTHSKGTLKSDAIFPTISLVDAQLSVSMPRKTTALTGIDAFAHAFESYIGSQTNTFSSIFSKQAMELFVKHMKTACLHGDDMVAREQMALCSTLGGLAISHSATTLPHGIGQALSGVCDAPHGGSIAVCMPQILRWTLPVCEEKFAEVACMFDPSLTHVSREQQATALPDILETCFHEILGETITMRDYGLEMSQIEQVADMTLSNYKGDVSRHPKVANREQLIAIIKQCM